MLYSLNVLEKAIFIVLGFPLSHTVLFYVESVAIRLGISYLDTRPEARRLLLALINRPISLTATHYPRQCLTHIRLHGGH